MKQFYLSWRYRSRHRRRSIEDQYPPVPRDPLLPRPRSLSLTSLSLPAATRSLAETAISESAFFTVLPLELRRHVYTYLFSGWKFELEIWLGHLRGRSGLQPVLYCHNSTQWGQLRCPFRLLDWLLVCRQAYTETITYFYTTNTFSLSLREDILFRHPDSCLLPRRISQITSLELVSTVTLYDTPNRQYVSHTLSTIPHTFPALRSCVITVQNYPCPIIPRNIILGLLRPSSRLTFPAIDRMVGEMVRSGMRQLDEFYLDVSDYMYELLEQLNTSSSEGGDARPAPEGVRRPLSVRSFWRPVDVQLDGAIIERGYWVRTLFGRIPVT